MQVRLESSLLVPRRQPVKLVLHSGRKPRVDDVVRQVTDERRPGTLVIGELPLPEAVELLVEVGRERADPPPQLLGDEPLQDLRQRVLRADILVPRGLVDERNDPDAGEASDEDLALLRQMLLL